MNIIERISEDLLMPEKELLNFSSTAPRRYKKYTIAKRNSDERRLIAHPSKEVKFLQRLLVTHLEDKLTIHASANAYVKQKGIKSNALAHKDNQYLLKMDFKNFFLSITPSILIEQMLAFGIGLDDRNIEFISGILFWKLRRNSPLRLSIGAPSSPFISNVIMYNFDRLIEKECKVMGITYTRYADDLAFSTNIKDILFEIPKLVKNTLKKLYGSKIRVNTKKTVFSSKKFNRHITGITLTNNNLLSIGRKKKRFISSLVHKYTLELLSDEEILQLKGLLSHVSNIEPLFIGRLSNKYGTNIMTDLAPSKFFIGN
ncbi:MAG: RNA-directed DNA polymerase [Pseudoalteromonas tetraodonis]|jgi:RNA-directed DNA polymerase|uniref:retron St85 family RNA-directed DNA polymerase n=1 Tax=Pseudoalteromonas TaxID=53246 RepID=UPI0001EF8945|nr:MULTISPECIES: retron St85 family RNA-directed DNA polymerase [unclassified Pseudoalteromonas]ADT67495.1 reverse transcriptase [Pseudoalteromonas sp. SM9913]MAD74149.1 RNA-directed DNA polymerase [Rheinheimera sp.]MDN3435380.1 retron St85 family RNA-directed DNA polymerase [Pseudoalteromonas sp. APC 3356]MDN3487425.1 retron St85 family RNA-directed DNA polymerase [Pseudoalteromonas sp. APC 3224]|tara:strand:+ start:1548 stop:2492 length:945 start_codon:yes stop_codon:yes gene_type:complete